MEDWVEWVQFCIITLIFAYMVVGLISVVQSFMEQRLRIEREHTDNLEGFEIEEERVAENSDLSQITPAQDVDTPVTIETKPTEGVHSGSTHETFERTVINSAFVADVHSPSLVALVADAHLPLDGIKNAASPKKGLHEEEEEESLVSDDDDWEGIDGSDLDKTFSKAASYLEKMVLDPSIKMSNEMKLQFYGLYKQATEGPCSSAQPPAFRLSARAKWNAWKVWGDLSPADGMQRYIALLSELWPQWNQDSKDEKLAGISEVTPAGSSRKTPSMGPVFSTMLSDAIEQESLDGIHKCAKAGDLVGLERLLQSNTAVDEKDGDGRTALHWAADQGHLEMIKLLISRGAEVNARDAEGQTALHYAATCEWEEIAAFLLQSGADSSLVDNDGCTPYELSSSPDKEIVDVK